MVEPSQSTSNMHSSESETQGPGGGNSRDGHVPGRGVPIGSNSDGGKKVTDNSVKHGSSFNSYSSTLLVQ